MARSTLLLLVSLTGIVGCPWPSVFTMPGRDAGAPSAVDDAGTVVPPGQCELAAPSPGRAPLRLLTRRELDLTLEDLLDDDSRPASRLPPENEAMGFGNGEAHGASPLVVDGLLEIAFDVAARAVARPDLTTLLGCDPAADGEVACGESFVGRFLSRAFRRPVTFAEFQAFDALFLETRASTSFVDGIRLVVAGALVSPQFLYRLEHGNDDVGTDDVVPLSSYEMASRLSYFLWDSMPDDALLALAAEDGLATADDVAREARRMLAAPRARAMVSEFHRQWLGLDGLGRAVKDDSVTGPLPDELPTRWRASLDRFVEDVYFDGEGSVATLFGSSTVYLDPGLAALYGVSVDEPGFHGVELPADERRGLLTQPALLALLANADQSSPIRRGVFVRERILCETLPPPPDDVPITPPDPDPSLTTRERFAIHTQNPMCADCHLLIDPVGFGFEQYDAIGRFRTVENGLVVDASGELAYTWSGDQALEGPFVGAVELSSRLGASAQVRDCVATQWFRYATGRIETAADACSLGRAQEELASPTTTLQDLLVSIVTSDAFRYRPRVIAEEDDG